METAEKDPEVDGEKELERKRGEDKHGSSKESFLKRK
jgi:hypothetical protein